jgi:hypothetical protein
LARRDANAFLIGFHREARYHPARVSTEVTASETSFPAHDRLERFWKDGDTPGGGFNLKPME